MNNSTLGMLILAFIALFGAISFLCEFFRARAVSKDQAGQDGRR